LPREQEHEREETVRYVFRDDKLLPHVGEDKHKPQDDQQQYGLARNRNYALD
jgi:hypothetical protein